MAPLDRARGQLLRRLAINDEAAVEAAVHAPLGDDASSLDPKTDALVRLAGVIALASSPVSYQWGVARALAAGASDDEIIGVLASLVPVVGLVSVHRAAPELSIALGVELNPPGSDR
jgi:4-carboxymuconolactone decarboxylase